MSLVDPSGRWWNRSLTRRRAAWVCWLISSALTLHIGWESVVAYDAPSDGGTVITFAVLFPLSLLLLIGGGFLHAFGSSSDEYDPRTVFVPLGGMFLTQGIGGIARAMVDDLEVPKVSVAFAAAGAVAIALTLAISARIFANRDLRARVERHGVACQGRVTRARSYSLNYSPVTRVTVQFTDTDGNTRWASQTVGGNIHQGAQVRVRYSPQDLGRKAAVVVTPILGRQSRWP